MKTKLSTESDRNAITNSVAKKLNTILITMSLVGAPYIYADCPSVEEMKRNAKEKFVVNAGMTWTSNSKVNILQTVKSGIQFIHATGQGVDVDDGSIPSAHLVLYDFECEYINTASDEHKSETVEDQSHGLILLAHHSAAYEITHPRFGGMPSPWVLDKEATRKLYAGIVRYDCYSAMNLVKSCPFSLAAEQKGPFN